MDDLERTIVIRTIDALLDANFAISVRDGVEGDGEFVLRNSLRKSAILAAMFTTDGDVLYVRRPDNGVQGWVAFIYGNGEDVIHDYTINLEPVIGPVQAWIDGTAERLA